MSTGTFAIWMFKGFKGPLKNELVSVDERNSTKGIKRIVLGILIWILIALIIVAIFREKAETRTYRPEDFNFK